jgi:hypothetical protein
MSEFYRFVYKDKEIVKHLSNNHRMGSYPHWTHAIEAIDDWVNAQG